MIELAQQGLADEGIAVSISQLCRGFEVPRRSVSYHQHKAAPRL